MDELDFFEDYKKRINRLYEGIITPENQIWLANLNSQKIAEFKELLRGTTIMAIKAKDAVIMAGDTRASALGHGGGVVTDKFDKILELDERSLIAVAGVVGWAKELVRRLKGEVRVYRDINETEMTTKGKVRRLAKLTGQFLGPAIQLNMMVVPILGTFDSNGGPLVFRFSVDQAYIEKDWVTEGSGGSDARGVLSDSYRKNLSKDEVIDLAKRALRAATTDLYTGPKRTIKVIDKNGIDVIEGV